MHIVLGCAIVYSAVFSSVATVAVSSDKPSCGPPPTFNAATVSDARRSEFDLGTVLTYKCNYSSLDTGETFTISCQFNEELEKAEWEDPGITCSSVLACGLPPKFDSASIEGDQKSAYVLGSKVTYKCKYGFVADVGKFTASCEYDEESDKAQWMVPQISCRPRSCGDPGYVANGHRKGHVFTFPNTVEFECYEGYTLIGSSTRYCQTTGLWSGTLPRCEEIICHLPSSPENGRALFHSLGYGARLEYECNKGFTLSHKESRICAEDGMWSNSAPTCIESSCKLIKKPENGFMTISGNPRVGSVALFSCEKGRTLVGSTSSKCLSTGDWTFPPPECLSTCIVPKIENGYIGKYRTKSEYLRQRSVLQPLGINSTVDHGDSVILKCADGYAVSESKNPEANTAEVEVLCENGNFSKLASCRRTMCTVPKIENGQIGKYEYKHRYSYLKTFKRMEHELVLHNQKLIALCDTGYIVASSAKPNTKEMEITCSNELWSADVECKPGFCHGKPPSTPHGVPHIKRNNHNHTIYYTCPRSCRKIEGNVTCIFGEWKGVPPRCICGSSSCSVDNLNYPGLKKPTRKVYVNNEEISVVCEEGYESTSEELSFKCRHGQWIGNKPPCKEARCLKDAPSSKHAIAFYSDRNHNSTVLYKCEEDYILVGASTIRCQYGEWTGHFPECIESTKTAVTENQRATTVEYPPKEQSTQSLLYEITTKSLIHEHATKSSPEETTKSSVDEQTKKSSVDEQTQKSSSDGLTTMPSLSKPNSTTTKLEAASSTNCSCKLGYKAAAVFAKMNGRQLWQNDEIPFANKVTFTCPLNLYLTWSNGLRIYGPATIQCDRCATWNEKDVPSCERGDSLVEFLSNVKILRGGIIEVKEKHVFEMYCMTRILHKPKLYKDNSCLNLEPYTVKKEDRHYSLVLFKPTEAEEKHSGKYECRSDSNHATPSIVHLKVAENSCDLISPSSDVSVSYSDRTRINSLAQFSCLGFKVLDRPEAAKCLNNGTWNQTAPSCIDIVCPDIKRTPFLEISFSDGLKFNSVANFSCPTGYNLKGKGKSRCLGNGTWRNPSPLCINPYIRCMEILGVEDYVVEYSNKERRAGSTVTFACRDPKSELVGRQTLTCYSDGRWSDPPPYCRANHCNLDSLMLVLPEDVVPREEDVKENYYGNSEVQLTCDGGNVLIGNTKAKCRGDNRWHFGDAQCVKGCNPIPRTDPLLKITPDKAYYTIGDIVDLSCPEEMKLSQDVVKMMCINFDWSPSISQTCIPEDN